MVVKVGEVLRRRLLERNYDRSATGSKFIGDRTYLAGECRPAQRGKARMCPIRFSTASPLHVSVPGVRRGRRAQLDPAERGASRFESAKDRHEVGRPRFRDPSQ